jgi:hypothetical protein
MDAAALRLTKIDLVAECSMVRSINRQMPAPIFYSHLLPAEIVRGRRFSRR